MDRIQFLSTLGALTLGGACFSLSGVSSGCAQISEIPAEDLGHALRVRKSDLGRRSYAMIHSASLPAPLYLVREKDGGYSAVLMLCTHKRCALNAAGDVLVCPCHGSEFTSVGEVLHGPAVSPLLTYSTRDDGDGILVLLR